MVSFSRPILVGRSLFSAQPHIAGIFLMCLGSPGLATNSMLHIQQINNDCTTTCHPKLANSVAWMVSRTSAFWWFLIVSVKVAWTACTDSTKTRILHLNLAYDFNPSNANPECKSRWGRSCDNLSRMLPKITYFKRGCEANTWYNWALSIQNNSSTWNELVEYQLFWLQKIENHTIKQKWIKLFLAILMHL